MTPQAATHKGNATREMILARASAYFASSCVRSVAATELSEMPRRECRASMALNAT